MSKLKLEDKIYGRLCAKFCAELASIHRKVACLKADNIPCNKTPEVNIEPEVFWGGLCTEYVKPNYDCPWGTSMEWDRLVSRAGKEGWDFMGWCRVKNDTNTNYKKVPFYFHHSKLEICAFAKFLKQK